MAWRPEKQSGETGRLIERFLGGPSVKPTVDSNLVNRMIQNDTLIPHSIKNRIDTNVLKNISDLINLSHLHEDLKNTALM